MKEFAVKAYASPEHNWWFLPHPDPPRNTRTEVPRFWVPSENTMREECRPFSKYAKILNELRCDEWEQLGLDEVLTSSPLPNVQLPELCNHRLLPVHALSDVPDSPVV